MTTVTLTLSMVSDWHIGTGTGRRGFADSLVKRDGQGLPYIPAKTITGVWRDACELAAYALDAGPAGPWHDWTEYLFGSQPALNTAGTPAPGGEGGPRPAALSVRSMHYPAQVGQVLAEKPRLAASATFLKPGVAINRATGRAEHKQLRYDELARAGAVLAGTAEVAGFEQLDAGRQRAAATLLAVGAKLVESIGGKRRRGTGRCTLELDGIAADLDWLAGDDQPSPPPASSTGLGPDEQLTGAAWPLPAGRTGSADWEIADLRLELRTPVVAHDVTVGNAVRTLDYVPGWLLLPAVLQRLAGASASGARADAPSAARAGDLIVTNATLQVNGRAGRPGPRPQTGYTAQAADDRRAEIRQVRLTEHAHNAIKDAVQRPTEAVGGLFTKQAISAGTVLRAQVRAPAGLLRSGWQGRLAGDWRVGRSSKDDYGLVSVTSDVASDVAQPASAKVPARTLHAWLLSDLLVNDCRLRPSSDPADVAGVLGRALGGIALTPAAGSAGRAASSVADRRLESWQRRWGLPRPSLIGIAGGSHLTFSIDGPGPTPAAVRQVELTGIGLRRSEGFGQVSFNDPLPLLFFDYEKGPQGAVPAAGTPALKPVSANSSGVPGSVPPARADDALHAIEEAAWRQEIAERAERLAATDSGRQTVLGPGYDRVPASQLSALRMVTAGLRSGPDDRTRYWLDRLTASGRDSSWPPEVRAHLTSLLTTPDTVWRHLGLPEAELSRSPDAAFDLRHRLWPRAVQAVAAACLTALRRESGEASDG